MWTEGRQGKRKGRMGSVEPWRERKHWIRGNGRRGEEAKRSEGRKKCEGEETLDKKRQKEREGEETRD